MRDGELIIDDILSQTHPEGRYAPHTMPGKVQEGIRMEREMSMVRNLLVLRREEVDIAIKMVTARVRKFGILQGGKLWDKLAAQNGLRITPEQATLHLLREEKDGEDEQTECQLCGQALYGARWIVCLPCYERTTGAHDNPAPPEQGP